MGKTRESETATAIDETSQRYVGQWNHLISTTNWEKGRIISGWRADLEAAGALSREFSDEAWSRRVGNVSPQHVGRLRRVDARFGGEWHDYKGLYWSHFQSALEWEDAELWLEGAVQNSWSVSQMRIARWEALGAPADLKPRDEDIISAELDEDVATVLDAGDGRPAATKYDTVRDPSGEETFGPDFGDERNSTNADLDGDAVPFAEGTADEPRIRPFAELAELPSDLSESFESFKLAILHHKLDGWQEVTRDDVISTLEALKELVLAP